MIHRMFIQMVGAGAEWINVADKPNVGTTCPGPGLIDFTLNTLPIFTIVTCSATLFMYLVRWSGEYIWRTVLEDVVLGYCFRKRVDERKKNSGYDPGVRFPRAVDATDLAFSEDGKALQFFRVLRIYLEFALDRDLEIAFWSAWMGEKWKQKYLKYDRFTFVSIELQHHDNMLYCYERVADEAGENEFKSVKDQNKPN